MIRPALATMSITALLATAALASDAETSASAGSNRYQPNGTAAATARYEGDLGFARTNTRSGPVSSARGVAVGFDESGLSLSVSNAAASRFGPAVATTFNLSIDRDGSVSRSGGLAVSNGPIYRSATAGGRVGTGREGRVATAIASGQTDRFGHVQAVTRSQNDRPRPVLGIRRTAPSEVRRYRTYRR
jgi:hypothetical protein